jgi:hypothetical protein
MDSISAIASRNLFSVDNELIAATTADEDHNRANDQ